MFKGFLKTESLGLGNWKHLCSKVFIEDPGGGLIKIGLCSQAQWAEVYPRIPWRQERTGSSKLFSDLYIYEVACVHTKTHACTHTHTHLHTFKNINKMFKCLSWGWEIAQAKGLLHKHRDLSSDSRHPHKKLGTGAGNCNPSAGMVGTGSFQGFAGQSA